jgi:hypothetical protein
MVVRWQKTGGAIREIAPTPTVAFFGVPATSATTGYTELPEQRRNANDRFAVEEYALFLINLAYGSVSISRALTIPY